MAKKSSKGIGQGGKGSSDESGAASSSQKGGGAAPATKQTKHPAGVSTTGGKGKKPPVTGRAKRGAPKG